MSLRSVPGVLLFAESRRGRSETKYAVELTDDTQVQRKIISPASIVSCLLACGCYTGPVLDPIDQKTTVLSAIVENS